MARDIKFTPKLVDRVCALLEEGRTQEEIIALPGMPVRVTFARWKRQYPSFARRFELARQAGIDREQERVVNEICTQLALGRQLSEICAMPGMPAVDTVDAWRRNSPHLNLKVQQAWKMDEERAQEAICEGLANGRPLNAICTLPGMPGSRTVYSWLDADAEFAKKFKRAREIGIDRLADEVLEIADNPTLGLAERRIRADMRLRLLNLWTRVKKTVPEPPPEPEVDVLAEVFKRIRGGARYEG